MDTAALSKPIWIDRRQALEHLAAELLRHTQVAVDTESNSLFAYQEQVCLIQFSTPTTDYLLDPLALPDLSPLAPLFANPAIEKIFHAAEYDLICLKRDFDFTFANIFDTMQAARILGKTAFGLGAILEESFGITLNKRYQRANWGERPLSAPMLDYARMDTHYLIPLRARLAAELETSGRKPMAQEDFTRLCAVEAGSLHENGQDWWRVSGGRDLIPQQAAVLQALCDYRDQQARNANLPRFKVLNDDVLITLAETCPQTLAELKPIPHLGPRNIEKHGVRLLAAIQRGLKSPPLHRPSHPRPDDAYLFRLDLLREWRKVTGRELGVDSDVILPRDTMEHIAQANPATLSELQDQMPLLPWRFNRFGAEILRVLPPKVKS